MSLAEIIDQRIEFDQHPVCPACGCMNHLMIFTTASTIRDGRGCMTIEVTTLGESDPHLIITCTRCGLEREMETYR